LSALPVGAGGGNKGLDFNARERANMGWQDEHDDLGSFIPLHVAVDPDLLKLFATKRRCWFLARGAYLSNSICKHVVVISATLTDFFLKKNTVEPDS
jgi:hypothetical protein